MKDFLLCISRYRGLYNPETADVCGNVLHAVSPSYGPDEQVQTNNNLQLRTMLTFIVVSLSCQIIVNLGLNFTVSYKDEDILVEALKQATAERKLFLHFMW